MAIANGKKPRKASHPWQREANRIFSLVEPLDSTDKGPFQAFLIEDPPGYGAEGILQSMLGLLRRDPHRFTAWAPVLFPSRSDEIVDWPSLAIAILDRAHKENPAWGAPAALLKSMQREFGETVFREEVQRTLLGKLKENGRLTLLIPRIDQLLANMNPVEHWAFRGVLQSAPLALFATSAPHWAPGDKVAFYEFFRRVRPRGYIASDADSLAEMLNLSKQARDSIGRIIPPLMGAPSLIDAALSLLAHDPEIGIGSLLASVVATHGTPAHIAIETLAPQTRQVLRACIEAGLPASSGQVSGLTGIVPGAVTTQLARLEESNLLMPTSRGRDRTWTFKTPVLELLYRALVQTERELENWVKSKNDLGGAHPAN